MVKNLGPLAIQTSRIDTEEWIEDDETILEAEKPKFNIRFGNFNNEDYKYDYYVIFQLWTICIELSIHWKKLD